jgi:hypothetical protein
VILLDNSNDLLSTIQNISSKLADNIKITDVLYGKVTKEKPLEISVEQKMVLSEPQLVLSRNVTNHKVKITVDWNTEKENEHKHKVTGTKEITIHNKLKTGEEVILIRMLGGQQFLVLDRMVK